MHHRRLTTLLLVFSVPLVLMGILGGMALLWGGALASSMSRGGKPDGLIVYCAQDMDFAEGLFKDFTAATGIQVRPVFDSELTKTVGLVNRLVAEKDRPRADVFWGNEELRTRQMAALGVFGTNEVVAGDQGWVAFGYRHRQLVVNTDLVERRDWPGSLVELTNARWKGKVSIAVPLFGTTSTHFHALRDGWGEERWRQWCGALLANQPFFEPGNSHVVRRVGRGEAWVGLTDSDDIRVGCSQGFRIEGLPLVEDMLVIPNTVALVRPAAPGSPARQLVSYLTSREAVARLVSAGALEGPQPPKGKWLEPDWPRVLGSLDRVVRELEGMFHR